MRKYGKKRKLLLSALTAALVGVLCPATALLYASAAELAEPVVTDLIASSAAGDWFHNQTADNGEEDFGTWQAGTETVTVDSYGMPYAIEGATYLTTKGQALGAFEMSADFVIQEINDVENPMIGIIPWYVDEENYLFVQLKFTWAAEYRTTPEEEAQGYALQEIIVSGRLDGEAKYSGTSSQLENTTFDARETAAIAQAKRDPLSAQGHTLRVVAENSGSSGNFVRFTVYYNDVSVGNVSAYYYNKIPKTYAMGFMAQDVRAAFSDATFTDGYALNNTPALARDWIEKNGFTYKAINGYDAWTFRDDGSVSFVTAETEGENGTSEYGVSGSNFAGYNTNRGYTVNPYAEANGLPQNYEVSASFRVDETEEFTGGSAYVFGYGLIPWMKDDQNFVSATIRRTESGRVGFTTVRYEVVLYGWIDGSNLGVGSTVYTLPQDFDVTEEHTLRVEKKSVGFFVYLDDAAEPVVSKRIAGTNENYYYGYEGYNVNFTASALESRAIYSAYDEISSVDAEGNIWQSAGKSQTAWTLGADGAISVTAKETGSGQTALSYLLGASDISDTNITITADVTVERGTDSQFSELLFVPYQADEHNFVRAGFAWHDGGVYARIYACTYTEDDEFEGNDPHYTVKECRLDVSLSDTFTMSVRKIGTGVAVYVNGEMVYGRYIDDIAAVTPDIGIYVYNMDLEISGFETEGYKKYTQVQVGDWLTSGLKNNQWTINADGWILCDATYTPDMSTEDAALDESLSWALVENPNGDYTITATVRVTDISRAEDRVGIVVWYLDQDNYLLFYMDHWRSDSTVPRTTLTGEIGGEYLPTRYNHGGWFAEGTQTNEDGLTITEASQLTQWHTITVTKSGNTFTCSVDGTMGRLTYTVSDLPSSDGKTVYSGLYVLNDKVEYSEWAITPAGQTVSVSTPADPEDETQIVEEKLDIGAYTDADYTEEFDGVTTSGGSVEPGPGDDSSDSASSGDSTGGSSGNSSSGKKGCGSVTAGFVSVAAVALLLAVFRKKKIN